MKKSIWTAPALALLLALASVASQAATTCVATTSAAYQYDSTSGKLPKNEKSPCVDGVAKLADVQTAIKGKGVILANVASLSFPSEDKPAGKAGETAVPSSGAATAAAKGGAAPVVDGVVSTAAGDLTPVSTTAAPGQQVASTPPAPPVAPTRLWELQAKDLSIYAAMKRWATIEGYQVSWEIPMDFPTTILDTYNGTFEDAVTRVLEAFKSADYPPKGCFYENHVLRVVRRTGDGKECFR